MKHTYTNASTKLKEKIIIAGITHLSEFQAENLNKLVDVLAKENNEVETIGNEFLPMRNVFSNKFAYDLIKKKTHIASYIGFGSEPPVMDRDAVASRHGELAKLGIKHIVTEEELLSIHQARSNAEQRAMIDQLVAKGVDLVNAVYLQIEVSRLKALFLGEFSYNDGNVKIGLDYGVENKVELTGTEAWDKETATPLSDLIKWNDEYVDRNGQSADVIFMSRETRAMLQTSPEIVKEARGDSPATRVSVSELNEVLGGYDLPEIRIVERRSVTAHDIVSGENVVHEYFPKHRVVFASHGVGEYQLGITVENGFAPGINLTAKDKDEPIQSIMRSVAAGFPVIEDPELLFYADVAEVTP